mmetsp:Transcript_2072/g.4881  ORF Transcript_2072/g.4881 Transcript_2072/m.4881 type:complete len:236 (+) Transcript_2072:111-818(+)
MSSPYLPMSNFATPKAGEVSDYHNWNAEKLAEFFNSKGLGAYSDTLIQHKITGPLAPLLSDDDLKDMGITIVGDRLMFKHYIKQLSRHDRFTNRVKSMWEGEEQLFYSECDKTCITCCGFCPIDPSTYKLTTSHLRVNKVQHTRCGPIPLCCFGATHLSNNIDLSKVDDVDVTGTPAPCLQRVCCCANGKDVVEVDSRFDKEGKVYLTLAQGDGERVTNLILNQVEEAQKMDRGF